MKSKPPYAVCVDRDLCISMADGTVLLADHYAARGEDPFPTILIRSFWGRTWRQAPFSLLYMFMARRFARAGYHVVLQDVHQRIPNIGEHPMPHAWEISDGHDTLAWLAKQPWFDGRVGLWGASYLGYAAWAAAAGQQQDPVAGVESLSLYLATTATDWYHTFHNSGAFALDTALRLQYMLSIIGKPLSIFLTRMLRQEASVRKAASAVPLVDAGSMLPKASGFDLEALIHQNNPQADFWRCIRIDASSVSRSAAVHLVAGWFDVFLKAQLADYETLKSLGARPQLTIGPWHHTDLRLGMHTISDGLVWFDSTLKGKWGSERKEKGEEELGLKAVRVWLMGAEKWIELDEWPPNSSYETLYLSSTNELTSQPSDEVERTTTFRYDPADPTPSVGGAVINSHPGMRDQVKIEERNDVLVFTGPTLETNLDIVGTPVVNLHISATLESWDVVARLCDVDEWGRSTNVCEGIWRHAGNSKAGEPIRLELWPTAHRFKPGHKMRLQIAGAAHPRWGRNLGADGLNADADDMRACNYVLHNSTGQESYLELPVWLPQD